ncbi:putative C-type lectin domain family 20 member A isoform X1, partial [Clarias magur]
MEQHLFILLLFTGAITVVLSVHRKYYLVQQAMTWSDAQAYCRAHHVDLAIIESNDDLVQLQDEIQKQQLSASAWIGLYNDVNSWRWSMGNEPLGSVTLWGTDLPNNKGGHCECVFTSYWGWYDWACSDPTPFVCFDGTKIGDERYIFIDNSVTWSDALAYCRQYHTDLASARSEAENLVIRSFTPYGVWIGLYRDGWKWVDKSNLSPSPVSWMSGKPDNALGNENCGYFYHGQAADAQCTDLMPFFCYRVSTGQQTMRVKVQSEEDVNNPAVETAILEQ